MKLADFQKYLRALADAITSARGESKALIEAANALGPFAHQSMSEFASFLSLASTTYFETGRLPTAAPPKPKVAKPKAEKVTIEQLLSTLTSFRQRLAQGESITRSMVEESLAKFEPLPKSSLEDVVSEMGYQKKPKSKKVALEMMVNRLLAGTIAEARAQV